MYLSVLLVFITACAVTKVAAQTEEPSLRWNKVCDDTLVNCTDTYQKGMKNKETINWYYNCVYRIHCERWSDGFYKRQNTLGKIQAQKEFYDPNPEWWKNEGCKLGLSLASVPLLLTVLKAIHGILQ